MSEFISTLLFLASATAFIFLCSLCFGIDDCEEEPMIDVMPETRLTDRSKRA